MKTIIKYIRVEKLSIIFNLIIKFIGTIIELLLPWMLSVILDKYVPMKDMRYITLWGLLMIFAAAIAFAMNVYANRTATRISRDITQRLRYDLFEKVMSLSKSQEDDFTSSSLISRLTSDIYNVHQMIDRMQRLGVRAPVLLLGGIIITFIMEPVLTLVLIGTLPLLAIVVIFISRKGIRMYTMTQRAIDIMIRKAQESMTGIKVVKALSKTDYEIDQFEIASKNVMKRDQSAGYLMNITNPSMNLLLNIGLTLVIIVGAYRVNAGVTQAGVIVAFLSYFTIILTALMMVSRMFVLYSKGVASGNRIEEVLIVKEDLQLEEHCENHSENYIEFKNVDFSYNKKKNNLNNISFSLKKGETLGIIGQTGSGKSTIINLLLRLYDLDKGNIYIDGIDIRTMPKDILYSIFGIVFQNDFLYAGEIGENIDFGRNLDLKDIEKAIDIAQAEFINERVNGLSGPISFRGDNLSGGQKQRVLISRALAGKPKILILDDSSSALDYKTDAKFRKSLEKEFPDTTKIIIAQRISSIQHADKILVLDNGFEIGYGNHGELLKSSSLYREIYNVQMGAML